MFPCCADCAAIHGSTPAFERDACKGRPVVDRLNPTPNPPGALARCSSYIVSAKTAF